MKVLIVEDEELAVERLEEMITKYDESIQIMDRLDTVKDTVEFLRSSKQQPDLLFLDIQLADGFSFDIFDHISSTKPVIFTTAYDQYSLKAFKLNSVDYLLKPVKYKELEEALDKYKSVFGSGKTNQMVDLSELKNLLREVKNPYKKRFMAKHGNRLHYKAVEEIAYFYADDKIVYMLEHNSSKRFVLDYTLEELETQFLNPEKFFRINRKTIVSLDSINEIRTHPHQRLEIQLKAFQEIPMIVSREKVNSFKNWLNH
jgi:DNA-binding LytR/AlgR family response regulator